MDTSPHFQSLPATDVGTRVVILAPFKRDNGQRDRLWRFCRDWWERNCQWPIYLGECGEAERFSRSVAVNRAAEAADRRGRWSLAIIIDGDVILRSIDQVHQAVYLAASTGRMSFAHSWKFALSKSATEGILGGYAVLPSLPFEEGIERDYPAILEPENGSEGPTFSSCQVVRRDLWDRIGGFDERFIQWGCEDWAFWTACNAMGGGHTRVFGAVYHLYHDRLGESDHPHFRENVKLGSRYLAAQNDAQKMAALIQEWKDLRFAERLL